MTYKILKLKSGEELIAMITEKNKRTFTLTRPMIFKTATVTDPVGRPYDMTLLKDWLIHSTEKEVHLPKTYIASVLDPTQEIQKMYASEMQRLDELSLMPKQTDEILKKIKEKKNAAVSDEEILNEIFGNLFKEMEEMGEQAINEAMEQDQSPQLPMQDQEQNAFERPMLYISMMLPPEAIMNLISAGILDPKQMGKIVKKIKKDNKFTGDEKERPDFGNKWTDWNPDPKSNDYQ